MRANDCGKTMPFPSTVDVLVVGGGIAGYCAAIAARLAGAEVRLIDRAPRSLRGGNARHSRNLRLAHAGPSRLFPSRYPSAEMLRDLQHASGGLGDERLARILAEKSLGLPAWLQTQGVRFEEPADGNLPWSRKTAFLLGGGKAMINALARRAERLRVSLHQQTSALGLSQQTPLSHRVPLRIGDAHTELFARALILCCGGYQANVDWLSEEWGEAARGFIVRGMPFADGAVLKTLLAQGAAPAGRPGSAHLVAVDARSPRVDGGIVTRVDGMPWGIVVDISGQRFHDEGAELSPRRYSTWGRLIAGCDRQRAYLILDADGRRRMTPSIYPAIEADDCGGLARRLDLDPEALRKTLDDYNRAVHRHGPDMGHTEGLVPPKSQRALPIRRPPLAGYPMAPGITFTSYGIQVNEDAQVMRSDGSRWPGVYAAGTIMAPAILGTGYLAGIGLTISAVFGRIAGEKAAQYVLASR